MSSNYAVHRIFFDADGSPRLIDDNGKDITDFDVRGELCVRGPTVIQGYFSNPKANADSYTRDGWFKTGDILYCDRKTKLWYIVDRKKVR